MAEMAQRTLPWDRDVCRHGFRLPLLESPPPGHRSPALCSAMARGVGRYGFCLPMPERPPPGRLSPGHQSSSSGESAAGASIFRQSAAHSRPIQGEPGRAESSEFLA